MAKDAGPVEVFAEIKHETAKAWLLSDGLKEEWVPKSETEQIGDGMFLMPEWLAKKKGFI